MSLQCMPDNGSMKFFEDHVNAHCRAPAWEGEPMRFTMPQRINPLNMSKTRRKKENRCFEVRVLFVGVPAVENGARVLRWRYQDIEVSELV